LPGVFRNFDVASPDAHSPQRLQTTVPQQGLYLLNSGFVAELAQRIGQRVSTEPDDATLDEDLGDIQFLFMQILGRVPNRAEIESATTFVSGTGSNPTQPVQVWICGYGQLDPDSGELTSFGRLPYFTGSAWQGGKSLPDTKLGWSLLNKDGGHPGNDLQHAVVRRWIAPHSGQVTVRGKLNHKSEMGNGVRATLISGQHGKLGQWNAKHEESRTLVSDIQVEPGQTLDLVTDCLDDVSNDSFEWKVRIQYQNGGATYDSSRELPGPQPTPLSPWDQLAQALMASNEFAFVD
jgi:Protein of unknown function (DUF1553)